MCHMVSEHFRINDVEIQEWLKTKKNKSEVTRKALKLLYQKELQEQYKTQDIKPRLIRIA